MRRIPALLIAAVLTAGGYSAAWAADPGANTFRYETGRWTPVAITLTVTDGQPALLSFYSEGANGLRLLENAFTDAQGHYAGDLRLPAHLTQVVVVVRTADRQDTLTLPITDAGIAYDE